jgi:hypothetical protein
MKGKKGILCQVVHVIGGQVRAPGDPITNQGIVDLVQVMPAKGATLDDGAAEKLQAKGFVGAIGAITLAAKRQLT